MRQFHLFLALVAAAVCSIAARAYSPPVGIPNPADYFEGFDPVDSPKPDPRAHAPGWFASAPRANAKALGDAYDCYYVDNSHPSATDSGNPYGHPGKPRATIPNLAFTAGAYIEIHGDGGTGQYKYTSPFRPAGVGTSDNPIWFVGLNKPILTATCDIGSSNQPNIAYLVFDGLHWMLGGRLDIRPRFDNNHFRNITFRNCVFRGTEQGADATGVSVGASGNTPTRTVKHVVFHNCEVSHYGDKNAPGEECGVYPQYHVANMWFLDGKVHNNAEDGFGGSHGGKRTSTGYYIGRTKIYDNVTNGIDIKQMVVVVISECEISGHWASASRSSGSGENIVLHYSGNSTPGSESDAWKNWPEDVSVLNCTLSDADFGIAISSIGRFRAIGNVFKNIRHSTSSWNPSSAYSMGTAIHARGLQDDVVISHNTIVACDNGIQIPDTIPSFDPSSSYFNGSRVMYNNKLYTCIKDNYPTAVKGIAPTNATYWSPVRIEISSNIISYRNEPEGRDLFISWGNWGESLKIDHILTFSPHGDSYSYGSSTIRDLEWIRRNTAHQANGLSADPKFKNLAAEDYQLTAGSPAIDAATDGINLSGFADYMARFSMDIRQDLAGLVRPLHGAFDIGAFEYAAGTGTPPPAPSSLTIQP